MVDPALTQTHTTDKASAHRRTHAYEVVPLCELPKAQAREFATALFHPEERFAQGFYRYWKDILLMSEDEAQEATRNETEQYLTALLNNLDDPYMRTVGERVDGVYVPVGIYGFRPLEKHVLGPDLIESMDESGLAKDYPGTLYMAHMFSALTGHRNRLMMKMVFWLIALDALENNVDHLFFFISDYRLGPIYNRLGLDFPEKLKFKSTEHLVGSFSISGDNLQAIYETTEAFKSWMHPTFPLADKLQRLWPLIEAEHAK